MSTGSRAPAELPTVRWGQGSGGLQPHSWGTPGQETEGRVTGKSKDELWFGHARGLHFSFHWILCYSSTLLVRVKVRIKVRVKVRVKGGPWPELRPVPQDKAAASECQSERVIVAYSPCDDATIFFLSSTEASLLHKDGYLLYREPRNMRR